MRLLVIHFIISLFHYFHVSSYGSQEEGEVLHK